MATLLGSVITTLRADATVLGLLAGSSNRVAAMGEVAPTSTFPLLVVSEGAWSGGTRLLPFTEPTFEVWACYRPEGRNASSWVEVAALLEAVQTALHGASLSAADDNLSIFQTAWEYRSGDLYDWRLKANYRYDKYRTFAALTIPHYHSA